jgi:hypothetical protein
MESKHAHWGCGEPIRTDEEMAALNPLWGDQRFLDHMDAVMRILCTVTAATTAEELYDTCLDGRVDPCEIIGMMRRTSETKPMPWMQSDLADALDRLAEARHENYLAENADLVEAIEEEWRYFDALDNGFGREDK